MPRMAIRETGQVNEPDRIEQGERVLRLNDIGIKSTLIEDDQLSKVSIAPSHHAPAAAINDFF